jgi:hypothetical protein
MLKLQGDWRTGADPERRALYDEQGERHNTEA